MALFRCGGGAALTSTNLWTNESPTSNFSAQAITLDSAYSNFDYIEIKYKLLAADAGTLSIIIPADECSSYPGGNGNELIYGGPSISNNGKARPVAFTDTTTMTFKTAYAVGTSGENASWCVPIEVNGLSF